MKEHTKSQVPVPWREGGGIYQPLAILFDIQDILFIFTEF